MTDRKKKKPQRACPVCGEWFTPTKLEARFCSQGCRLDYRDIRAKRLRPHEVREREDKEAKREARRAAREAYIEPPPPGAVAAGGYLLPDEAAVLRFRAIQRRKKLRLDAQSPSESEAGGELSGGSARKPVKFTTVAGPLRPRKHHDND